MEAVDSVATLQRCESATDSPSFPRENNADCITLCSRRRVVIRSFVNFARPLIFSTLFRGFTARLSVLAVVAFTITAHLSHNVLNVCKKAWLQVEKKGLIALFVSRVGDDVVLPSSFVLPWPGSIILTWPYQLNLAEDLDALALDESELAEEAEALFVVEADPSKE